MEHSFKTHHHCPSCQHCVAIHAISDDAKHTMCHYCYHTGQHCHANHEEIQGILAGQFIDLNRSFIEEVGV